MKKLKTLLTPLLQPLANYFEYSGGDNIDRFKADTVSTTVYPAIFVVATKEKRIERHGNIWLQIPVTIYVLTQKPEDSESDWENEEAAFAITEELVNRIFRAISKQEHPLRIEFTQGHAFTSERIMNVTMDMALGHEITTNLQVLETLCCHD